MELHETKRESSFGNQVYIDRESKSTPSKVRGASCQWLMSQIPGEDGTYQNRATQRGYEGCSAIIVPGDSTGPR